MWLRIAAKCSSATRIETLAAESTDDPTQWVRERVDALCSAGAYGALYLFIRQPPDSVLADVLEWVAAGGRLQPNVVAAGGALTARAHLELLQHVGVRTVFVTLHGATASAHDARTGEPGSWRRALLLLTKAPQLMQRLRVGVHLMLSPACAAELPAILGLVQRMRGAELLLWDAGCGGMDLVGLEPSAALRALDFAVTTGWKLGVRIRPVGFERTRTAGFRITRTGGRSTHSKLVMPAKAGIQAGRGVRRTLDSRLRGNDEPERSRPPVQSRTAGSGPRDTSCVATTAVVELLRDDVPLPSASTGVLAIDGESVPIAEAAPTGRAVVQLAFELAARGIPLLDLPACLGGPPPESGVTSPGVKVDACQQCPVDARCSGVPQPMMRITGLRDEIRPPRHWLRMPERTRVLMLCPIVSEGVYGTTFFSLARWLGRFGADVDVVTPWAIHPDMRPSSVEIQPTGRPDGASEVEKFISEGPVDCYDLIITPDPKVSHPLVLNRRLRGDTRLAVTDFHMLGGMDQWVRDLGVPGRRPEEGGWWPSDQIMLYSAFPSYARLYTRYGVPMRQVAWQPYALDPAFFPAERSVTEGTSIISAGHHRRDVDTLLSAAARLSAAVHPINLLAPGQAPTVPPLVRFHGTVATAIFCPMVGASRFMVVPLLEDPYNAAGITAIVTAITCGRPVVATDTAATRDYVTDGVNGVLVPPGDPQALAAAIERLDTDPSLLAALAAGARAVAEKLTTEAWARALLHGSRTYDADHWMWTKWRSRRARTGAATTGRHLDMGVRHESP